jgi:hypothetical protein
MNPQLIASGHNFLLQPWGNEGSRPSSTQDVFSQGYPPNASASVVTINLPPSNLELVSEPVELRLEFAERIDFFRDNLYFFQVPFVSKETKISPAIRPSDLIVHDLDELMAGKEDETKPTEFAYANARKVVESAYGRAFSKTRISYFMFPKPVVTTDDAGGIRLLWHEGAKQIRLNIGSAADRKTYLYFQAETQHGIDHGVEPLDKDNLATRLAWLTDK